MSWFTALLKLGAALAGCRTLLAYLDPGSGSLIAQILVAIIVGVLATFRFWKARLLLLFGISRETEEDDETGDSENDDADPV